MKGKYRRLLAACVLPILTVTVSVSVALGAAGLFSKSTVVADDEHVLQMGDNTVEITGIYPIPYAFTPEETGYYQFLSDNSASGIDPWASLSEIVDGVESYLTDDDDSGNGWNFRIMYKLTAGKTYYLNSGVSIDLAQPVEIGVNISKLPGLQLNVDTSVDLSGSSGYVYYTVTPEKTDYYEFSILADNARPSRYLYDGNSKQMSFASENGSSFVCKLEKGECYLLKIEKGYNDPPITATVSVKKYSPNVSGTCGENVQWAYDIETATLTISGSGAMDDYGYDETTYITTYAPWNFFRNDMKYLEIGDDITHIGSYAFYECAALTSVTIPDSVTSLGKWVFAQCNGVKTATIGSGLTELADHMLYYCTSLETVNISANADIKTIADSALYHCDVLENFTIPSTVTKIGPYAFGTCTVLNNVEIPSGVTSIGDGAFSNCKEFTEITIPNGVTAINDSTFYGCYKLASITVPNGVKSIGGYAFCNCQVLASVNIPEGVTRIEPYTFAYCYALSGIDIPDNVTYIGESAFYSCVNLPSVEIPEGVTSIEVATFRDCSLLKKVVLPSTVTTIGESAFNDCYQLSDITFPSGLTTIGQSAFYGCDALTSFTSGAELQRIGIAAFSNCDALVDVSIPSTKMIGIGISAFSNCDELKNVTIASGNIGEYAFNMCEKLETVTLGDGVSVVEQYAFMECPSIRNLSFGQGLTSIGFEAFMNCTSLESVTIPSGIIGDSAFAYCSNLVSLTLGEGVTSIGSDAFVCCSSIDDLTLPSSLVYVGKAAFNDCGSIEDVYCYADPDNLYWDGAYEGNDFISKFSVGGEKQTKCHVYANKLDKFTSSTTLSKVNVTYVGDLDNHILGARLYGYSLSLGGAIGVNFYMDISQANLSNDAYMLFTIPSGDNTTTEKVYVRDVVADETATVEMDGKPYYLFRCSVSAKDAASAITAQLIDREYSGSVYIFSVKEYAEYVLAHPGVEAFANASDMVKALLTYCTCAQKFFGTNPNNVDNNYITNGGLDEVTEIDCAAEVVALNQIPDVTFAGATLSLKSEITLSLYFESDVELKFDCDNDMTVEYAKVGDRYQVARIRGISAKNIGDSFQLKITCGNEEGMVKYSVLNYCSKVLEGNYSDDLKNVVKSIYLYYTAAKQYS